MNEYDALRVARCLKQNREKVLTLWSERARQEIPAASDKPELMLRDALPHFLNNLVKALSPNEPDDTSDEIRIAKEHAEQRSRQGDYSLGQVLAEYFILQKTLLEVLEVELGFPLPSANRDTILESVATAVKEAGSEFAKIQMSNLKKSNEALEHFAHIASHDLQEPLRTVSSYLSLIQMSIGPSLTGDLAEYFTFVTNAAKRMKSLIDGLLIYSQLSHIEEKRVPTDFNLMFKNAVSNLQEAIKAGNVRISSDPLPTLLALPIEIERLFQNLFSNAIKFCSNKRCVVHVSATQKDRSWVFSVSDNGIGIADLDRDGVFKLFSRLHTQAKIPGAGIGLSVCRRVAELHGGTIWAEGNDEGGATFKFTIPAPIADA